MPAEALAQIAEPVGAIEDHESFALGVNSSFAGRAWRMRERDEGAARALELSGYSAAIARLLASRGVTKESVDPFLEPRLRHLLPDPSSFAHMERAALRFVTAVEQSETIAILGDYDVDGACAAALLLRFLHGLKREPLLYVPDRLTEGYGPSPAAVRSVWAGGDH